LHQRAQVASEHLDLSLTVVGGTTVIFSADGRLRFVIPKPATHKERVRRQDAFLAHRIDSDPRCQYASTKQMRDLQKEKAYINFAALHRGY
jgi:hypothetical protein